MFKWSFKKRCLLTLTGFLLTFIPLLFPPGPLLVSEATTRIVGPVDESGKLRFRQYFNQAYDQVRPEDNGYELLADPPLPVDQDTPSHLHPSRLAQTPLGFILTWCNRDPIVGMRDAPFGDPSLIAPVNALVRPYFEEVLGRPWDERYPRRFDHHLLAAQLNYAMEHPWKKKDFPVLANYIQFNKQIVMDPLLQSAERPTYIPHIGLHDTPLGFSINSPTTEDSLINSNVYHDSDWICNNLGHALQLHTTLMIGEGQTSSWLNQLGRLHTSIRQQSTTSKVELVNVFQVRKETSLLTAYATILRHAGSDSQICQQLTEILDALPPALTETEFVDQVLRYYVLDFIQETKQFGTAPHWIRSINMELGLDVPSLSIVLGSVMTAFTNWDKETIHVHQWMDSLAETVREPVMEARTAAVQTWVAKLLRADMGLATRACLTVYLKPYLQNRLHNSELFHRDRMLLLRLQIAVERHRQRTGAYPNQLDQVEGITLNHGDPFPMSSFNLFFRGTDAAYMLGHSDSDLWKYTVPTAPLFHPEGHKFCRAHVSALNSLRRLQPIHIGGDAYELLRLDVEDVNLLEQQRQIGWISELQQAGARFYEPSWFYEHNERSTFTPILVWFSAAEANSFNDRLIPTLANFLAEQTSIHIVNLNETQVTSDGLIQLLELIAGAEDTDRDKPVTIECTAINEQVIGRFKELKSSQIRLH